MWYLLALLSGFSAAVLAIVIKLHLKNLNPFFMALIFAIITLTLLLLVSVCTKKINVSLFATLTLKQWKYLMIAGCLNSIALTAYLAALRTGTAYSVVAIDRLGILYVVLLSILFLQATYSLKTITGALLMIVGAFLLNS